MRVPASPVRARSAISMSGDEFCPPFIGSRRAAMASERKMKAPRYLRPARPFSPAVSMAAFRGAPEAAPPRLPESPPRRVGAEVATGELKARDGRMRDELPTCLSLQAAWVECVTSFDAWKIDVGPIFASITLLFKLKFLWENRLTNSRRY